MESVPKVRTVKSNHNNPKMIWIAQDLTKNARQLELDLRKQLNEKRTQDPENRYVIKKQGSGAQNVAACGTTEIIPPDATPQAYSII